MGPCTYWPIYAWPLLKGDVRHPAATLLQGSMFTSCWPRSVSCLAPAAEPFWSRGCVDMLLLLPPALGGGELDMQLLCLSLLSRTVAIHCLLSSAFWKFRSRARWSSPCCHTKATVSVLCRLQASLSHRRVQFCLRWTFQLRAYGSLSWALAKH